MFGEASVKMADAKRMHARTKPSPGSSFDPVDDIAIDMDPVDADMGNQYIKSIARLITA